MPINSKALERSVTPAQLAFPTGNRGGGGSGTTTYQQDVTNVVQSITNYVTTDVAQRKLDAIPALIMAAELRAKAYVDDWHNAFQWTMDATVEPQSILFNAWYPLEFPLCMQRGSVAANSVYWEFQATRETTGTYYIGAEIELKHAPAAAVASTEAAVFVDGAWYCNLGWTDVKDTESNALNPSHSHVRYGGALVPAIRGKRISIWVRITSGQVGDDYYTGSIGGHVHGFRVACHGDKTYRNFSDYNLATPNDSYTTP